MTDAAELVKLADCPFCGGTDLDTRGDNAIGCKNLSCEAYIDIGHSVGAEARAHVAARWNRRAAAPEREGLFDPKEIRLGLVEGGLVLLKEAVKAGDPPEEIIWRIEEELRQLRLRRHEQ